MTVADRQTPLKCEYQVDIAGPTAGPGRCRKSRIDQVDQPFPCAAHTGRSGARKDAGCPHSTPRRAHSEAPGVGSPQAILLQFPQDKLR